MPGRQDSIAFKPGLIGQMELKNRLVRSATYEAAATEKGEVTERQVELYRVLAQGGVGLIITGHAAVHPLNTIGHNMTRISDDSFITGVSRIAREVHDAGVDCKILLQLSHPGRQQPPDSGIEPVAPSPVFDNLFQRTPRPLTLEEIDEVIECFAHGIRRAQEAGFDGTQLHAGHGWLLSSFLSPRTNQREDQYGGSTENRARILREIYERGRKMVDPDFPILIKMNTQDFLPGGVDIEEAVKTGELLAGIGFNALEISGGMWEAITRSEEELGWKPVLLPESRVGIKTRDQEAYFQAGAREIKKKVDVPIILVGGIKSIDRIEELLQKGDADFCAMSRPLIRQPDLPSLWLSGQGPQTAACVSCNSCLPTDEGPTRCKAIEVKQD
ncbi:MAG: NADH:flavin oxidoreductase [Deltaproteobacteria bacterium]|nr:NADH:flavin oxidoreductase [Deltaproteobacteria bacterium]MBW2053845.1 NADH:flavin oxidoreductase [Deltaproteobacteria bacterium]MBW2142528.1 NADH:flavin oxidoreductase [Deltaproteobacteria bacterium]MBW2324598.1 NADH:flavin oxidoreductase [Deltaproteobacteria bacterium]